MVSKNHCFNSLNQKVMKKKDTFKKFAQNKIDNAAEVKGGLRAAPNMPGGSGGTGYIDWGNIDIRTDFGSITKRYGNKIFSAFFG